MFRSLPRSLAAVALTSALTVGALAMGQPAQADDQSPYGTYITTYRDDISCAWAALRFTQETGRSYRCYGSALWLMF